MRVIKNYSFKIGTKIPFSEWPQLIHRFLEDQHLTSRRFACDFLSYLGYGPNTGGGKHYCPEEYQKNLEKGACARILKDCPELGPFQIQSGESRNLPDYGIIDRDDFPEEKLLPLMKKIHRSYGFLECNLYYCDIDFFGNTVEGGSIWLSRDACGDNYMILSVDVLQDEKILDASPYYEAFKALVPKIKPTESMGIRLSEDEEHAVEERNKLAAPMLEECELFFKQRFINCDEQNSEPAQYSIAPVLKKLCKKHGYHYRYDNYAFDLEKRTAKGNYLHCEIASGPLRMDLLFIIYLRGIGFEHRLGTLNKPLKNQQELNVCLTQALDTVSKFEEALLPALEACFPDGPDWFE